MNAGEIDAVFFINEFIFFSSNADELRQFHEIGIEADRAFQ